MSAPTDPIVSPPAAAAPAVTPPLSTPPETPLAQTLVCANCGAALTGEYCATCGQRHEPHVHTVTHFAAEAFESLTHADSRVWRTLWFLLARPGRLTREFFAGRRVQYLPPFRLYLVISVVFFLVAGLPDAVHVNGDVHVNVDGAEVGKSKAETVEGLNEAAKALEGMTDSPDAAAAAAKIRAQLEKARAAQQKPAATAGDSDDDDSVPGLQSNNILTQFCEGFKKPGPKDNARYARVHEICAKTEADRGKAVFEAIVHNIPRAMFVFLPLLALFMKLLYWRPKRYYVEHLLLLLHNHAFVFLALAIAGLVGRIPAIANYMTWPTFAVWLYMIWYIFRAMRNYYQQSRGLTFAKYLVVGFAYFTTSVLVLALTAVYSLLTI